MNQQQDYSKEEVMQENFKKIDTLAGELLRFFNDKSAKISINNKDFIPCYTFVFNASSQDEKISRKLHENYEKKTSTYARQLLDKMNGFRDSEIRLLTEYIIAWENSKIFVRWMQKVFANLDKFYLKMVDKTLFHIGFTIFTTECFKVQAPRIAQLILAQINKERNEDIIDSDQVIKGIRCIYEMGHQKDVTLKKGGGDLVTSQYIYESKIEAKYYTEEFEKKLRDDTERFYKDKALEWLTLSVPEYVNQALKVLKDEEERCEKYYASSKKLIVATIEEAIIVKHHKTLVQNPNSGVMVMFNKRDKESLAKIFQLYNRAQETLVEILNVFGQYFEGKGKEIINDPNSTKDPLDFVAKMLEIKKEADDYVQHEFQANMLFQKKRDSTFQIILNKFDKAPGYFAAYVDFEFKKGLKGADEATVDQKLNSVKSLIFCISARDTFLKIYTKHLSGRLLNNTTLSTDYEKIMLEKMQKEWGHMVVLKIKSMLQDMEVSRQINQMFEEYLKNTKAKINYAFTVQVLTQGCWPENELTKVQVPEVLGEVKKEFERFHSTKYPGKVLTWVMSLGDAELGLNLGEKKFTLVSTNFQVCILLLFNNQDTWTYEQIKSKVEITDSELQANLLMLSVKYPILIKGSPEDKEKIDNTETLTFNAKFNSQTRRLVTKPAKITAARRPEETSELERDILKEREFIIDSVAIRVMKSRRVLDYNNIIIETKKLITMFTPDPTMMKKRIESLVEREYLKRDENDHTKFIYVP
jgi:hypothetical protein